MMLLIGMIYLQTEGIRWRERLTNVLLFVGISYPVYVYYKQCDILGLFSDFRFLSINAPALYTEFAVYNNGVLPAFGVGCLLTLVMLGIGLKKKAVPYITLIIVGVLFIYQGRAAIQAYLLPEQELQHSGNVIAELIEDKYEELDVYFMKEAYEAFHCSGYFQVRMPKEHILTLKDEQVLQLKEDCVVICDVYDVMSQQALEMVGFELIEKCETAVCYVRKMK